MGKYKGKKTAGPKKPQLTHFLCLPLVTPESKPQLEKSLNQFRDAVTTKDNVVAGDIESSSEAEPTTVIPGVHPKAIRPVGALHCTLGVMSLDQEKLQRAIDYLQTLDIGNLLHEVEDSRQSSGAFEVDLKGLVSMHTPRKTSILYSAPTDSDGKERLYPFCLALQKAFAEQRLLVEDDRKLKLHATIVNTIYAKGRKKEKKSLKAKPSDGGETGGSAANNNGLVAEDGCDKGVETEQKGGTSDERSQGHGPNANAPLKIDATAILEKYKDFVWAEKVKLDRIAICEMGAKKIMNDKGEVVAEEYREVASLKLPT